MIINEISFHDSTILKVTEKSKTQALDFKLYFPVDWDNNIFEKKVLIFENVTFYSLEEIPFGNLRTILNIIDLGETKKDLSTYGNSWVIVRKKIKIETNAGSRIIEFSDCGFV